MLRKRILCIAATALGVVAMLAMTASDAEARRGVRVRTYRPAPAVRYYSPPYAGSRFYYGPRAYRTGYRGYPYGYGYGYRGGVTVGAPGVGVSIGW